MKNEIIPMSPPCRAYCTTCKWKGKWRTSEWHANQDKKSHLASNKNHKAETWCIDPPDVDLAIGPPYCHAGCFTCNWFSGYQSHENAEIDMAEHVESNPGHEVYVDCIDTLKE